MERQNFAGKSGFLRRQRTCHCLIVGAGRPCGGLASAARPKPWSGNSLVVGDNSLDADSTRTSVNGCEEEAFRFCSVSAAVTQDIYIGLSFLHADLELPSLNLGEIILERDHVSASSKRALEPQQRRIATFIPDPPQKIVHVRL